MPESALWVHDEKNVNAAKLLAELFAPDFPVPVGVSRQHRGAHLRGDLIEQEQRAISDRGPGDIAKLLTSGDTWKIELTRARPAPPSSRSRSRAGSLRRGGRW